MSYEIVGTITRISDEKKVSDKFTYKEFILHIPGKFVQDIKFQVANKKLDIVDQTMIGKEATIHFNVQGKGYKGKGYFNTLSVFLIDGIKTDPYQAEQPDPEDILDGNEPF